MRNPPQGMQRFPIFATNIHNWPDCKAVLRYYDLHAGRNTSWKKCGFIFCLPTCIAYCPMQHLDTCFTLQSCWKLIVEMELVQTDWGKAKKAITSSPKNSRSPLKITGWWYTRLKSFRVGLISDHMLRQDTAKESASALIHRLNIWQCMMQCTNMREVGLNEWLY